MADIRVITLDCLLRRLEDEGCLTDAMVSLRLYPDEIRRLVEDTVMSWLFGARGDAIAGVLKVSPQG